jgi:aminobenzoyl-glutamate utilization protein B
MGDNMRSVGLPEWSEDDQTYARAIQELMNADEISGLPTEIEGITEPTEDPVSGGSDDIGDVSWNVPTVTLGFPANVDGLQFHHWSSSMAMATPIAHKGSTNGAKVLAATMMDLIQNEALLDDAWKYFREVQTVDSTYTPFISDEDLPAIEKNAAIMEQFRERQREFYYDPSNYDTYLEQLGIDYPQLTKPDGE